MVFEMNPVLNKDVVQDEFEGTSNATGSADEHEASPIPSSISEVVPSATSISKEIVVDPEVAPSDCAVQNEFQKNPTRSTDNRSSKGCGLLEIIHCKFATGDCEMDPDATTGTPPKGFWVFVWEAMNNSTVIILALCVIVSLTIRTVTEGWKEGWYDGSGITVDIVLVMLWCILQMEETSADAFLLSTDEISVEQRSKACCTNQQVNPRMGQTCVFNLWMKEGCWMYFIQNANGCMWGKAYRELQIHHVQPD
jgi:hypothetical protein